MDRVGVEPTTSAMRDEGETCTFDTSHSSLKFQKAVKTSHDSRMSKAVHSNASVENAQPSSLSFRCTDISLLQPAIFLLSPIFV